MYCANCGAKIKEGDVFCQYCGTKVQDGDMPLKKDTELKKKKLKWLILLIAVVTVWLFITKQKDEAEIIISGIRISETVWGNLEVTLTFENQMDEAVKDIEFLFMAWDENKLPVTVPDNFVYSDHPYYQDVLYEAANIPAGGKQKTTISVWNDLGKIHYVKPIVVSYTGYNGKTWEHPDAEALKKYLAGSELKRSDVFEMEYSN